jgi:hypothetical protein
MLEVTQYALSSFIQLETFLHLHVLSTSTVSVPYNMVDTFCMYGGSSLVWKADIK